MGWLSSNNKRAFAEKLMKDIRAREEKEKIDVIGEVSPEIQEKRASQNLQEKNSKKIQEIREEREKEDEKQEGQLLAIHGAKVKFNAHMGEFKVLNDVPTTQGKLTGTTVEKQIPNFTFYDGFQILSLTEWQDFGTVNVQDNFALLKKSTLPGTGKMQGNVPPESGKIEFVDSGQINVPESINSKGAPLPSNPISVTIGRVIRGNPYVEKNAIDIGLPDSIPLNKTYEVEISVNGTGTVDLAIINSSIDIGNATITPSSITATSKVIIKGTAMTNSGHGGQLKIEAKVAGVVVATSQGFTICCHPIDYTDTYFSDKNGSAIGFVVQDGWNSDNGIFSDLLNAEISELVAEVKSDSPPFFAMGTGTAQNSGYLPGDQLTKDTHTIAPRPRLGPAGTQEFHQLCIYKCNCCGANNIVMPKSGFKIVHEVFKTGTQWKHKIKKIGARVSVNSYTTQAGTANAISPDHNLP